MKKLILVFLGCFSTIQMSYGASAGVGSRCNSGPTTFTQKGKCGGSDQQHVASVRDRQTRQQRFDNASAFNSKRGMHGALSYEECHKPESEWTPFEYITYCDSSNGWNQSCCESYPQPCHTSCSQNCMSCPQPCHTSCPQTCMSCPQPCTTSCPQPCMSCPQPCTTTCSQNCMSCPQPCTTTCSQPSHGCACQPCFCQPCHCGEPCVYPTTSSCQPCYRDPCSGSPCMTQGYVHCEPRCQPCGTCHYTINCQTPCTINICLPNGYSSHCGSCCIGCSPCESCSPCCYPVDPSYGYQGGHQEVYPPINGKIYDSKMNGGVTPQPLQKNGEASSQEKEMMETSQKPQTRTLRRP